mgnify:CR=1 FL=1
MTTDFLTVVLTTVAVVSAILGFRHSRKAGRRATNGAYGRAYDRQTYAMKRWRLAALLFLASLLVQLYAD